MRYWKKKIVRRANLNITFAEDAEEQHSELGCGAGHDHEECAGQQAVEANAAMQLVIESHHDLNTSLPNKISSLCGGLL